MTNVPEPAPHAVGHDVADGFAIPGDPRPWLVWTPATPDGGLSPQLARVILDGYTMAGDVVIDVDDDAAFAATAAQLGRRHHALAGARHLATLGHAAGYIDLMLLRWPPEAVHPHWLFFACRALLRDAGYLVVSLTGERHRRIADLSALSGAASTAGLRIVDHVGVLAPDEGAAAPQNERHLGRHGTASPDGTPMPYPVIDVATVSPPTPHTDLLVFTAAVNADE